MNETDLNDDDASISLLDIAVVLAENLKSLIVVPLVASLAAIGISYLIAPTFTAKTTFLPPQQQQSTAASALASLNALSGLTGVSTRTPGDQYVALMRSTTISDRLVDDFKLSEVYGRRFRVETRAELASNVRIDIGKKDGLITIEVDDETPDRAAAIANGYVDELRRLTASLALTEAQQRRMFFEVQLQQTREKLTQAQLALAASGFNSGALRAEPKAAAEGYARLRAEITGGEVRLQTLRRSLTDTAPEVQQQLATLSALRSQLAQVEAADTSGTVPGYLSRYRDFKYQESLFEVFSRQFEMARLDESREGALIQVVDVAAPPERRSKPRRTVFAVGTGVATFFVLALSIVMHSAWRHATAHPRTASKMADLRRALRQV